MKLCRYCDTIKDEVDFSYRLKKITGCCIVCKRKKNAKYERQHREEAKKRKQNYLLNTPYYGSMMAAKSRCNNKNNKDYPSYGGRGIKFLMTPKEVQYLWKRDSAKIMKTPSLDRINNNGHYELNNCRFLEIIDNVKRQFEVQNEKN